MLGRKTYTQDELRSARAAVAEQLAAHAALAGAVAGDAAAQAAAEHLERVTFTNMALALDRRFVHRVRPVAGKDGNPLNELELICESLLDHGGVLRTNKVIRYDPAHSVLKLEPGAPISLSADDFDRLSSAFFAELEVRFLEA
jgi:hypothetical protein